MVSTPAYDVAGREFNPDEACSCTIFRCLKCFEHFLEPSPDELAAFKLVAKTLQESNLKGIGIFNMSNITVVTLNKFGKRARGCCVHVFLV